MAILLSACGSSDSTLGVDAGTTPTTSLASPEPGFAEAVGGEWELATTGTDHEIGREIAWAVAEKTDGTDICFYAELDPPPADDYFVDPFAPYSPDPEPMDVLTDEGLAEGAESVLDQFAGCAPVPPKLADYGEALKQPEVADPVAIFVENMDGLVYHFVDGVVSEDASTVRLVFGDNRTRDLEPVSGYFLAVFSPQDRLTEITVLNEEIAVSCTIQSVADIETPGCGGPTPS